MRLFSSKLFVFSFIAFAKLISTKQKKTKKDKNIFSHLLTLNITVFTHNKQINKVAKKIKVKCKIKLIGGKIISTAFKLSWIIERSKIWVKKASKITKAIKQSTTTTL